MDFLYSLRRNLRFCFRNKLLTYINIVGLGMGLAVTMFLLSYLGFEFSYDRNFKDADRIHRVLSIWEEDGEKEHYPICLRELGERLTKEVPEVEEAAQLYRWGRIYSKLGSAEKIRTEGYLVDSSFFRIFDFQLVSGKLDGIFGDPQQCVLTQSTAEKLFGKGVNPVGQLLDDGNDPPCLVVAIIRDMPENSHFKFDFLQSMEPKILGFAGLEFFTYLKFRENIDIPEARKKCNDLNKKLLIDSFSDETQARFGSVIEHLTSLHTSTLADFDLTRTNKLSGLIFVVLIGILVLGIALSNFISLFMIQGEKRSLEVGIRKAGGASRERVIGMLLGETFLITFLAFVLAAGLFVWLSGWASGLLNIRLPEISWRTGELWFGAMGLYLVTALCAGAYPAWSLSRYQPAELIRKSVVRKYRLTVASVVVQFSIVIFCVSALWIVMKQLDYVMKQPLGYNTENVVCYYVSMNQAQGKSIRAELAKYPFIQSVGVCQSEVESDGSGIGIRRVDQAANEDISADEHRIGVGYLETLGIPLLAGQGFTGNPKNDGRNIILSETALKSLQLPEPVIGKKIMRQGIEFTLIGVVGDTRYGSARADIGKIVYTSYSNSFFRLYVCFQPGKQKEADETVRAVLKEHFPGQAIEMSYLRDSIAYHYAQDNIIAKTLKGGVFLTVSLALLGLIALCGFVANQKSKEISLRRISGANVSDVIAYMNRYILIRIVPAIPIGILASYWMMNNWLNEFKFAIVIPWWIYGMTIAVILFSVVMVVFFRSWNIATANPVDALKSE